MHESGFISDQAKDDEAGQHASLRSHTHTTLPCMFCYRQQTSHHMCALVHDNCSTGHKRWQKLFKKSGVLALKFQVTSFNKCLHWMVKVMGLL